MSRVEESASTVAEVELRLVKAMTKAAAEGWRFARAKWCSPASKHCCALGSLELETGADLQASRVTYYAAALRLDEPIVWAIASGFDGIGTVEDPGTPRVEWWDLGRRLWDLARRQGWIARGVQ